MPDKPAPLLAFKTAPWMLAGALLVTVSENVFVA